jgi:hypothetical protein
MEAVAQTTHRSGASICDGTHAQGGSKVAHKWDENVVRAINRDTSPTS